MKRINRLTLTVAALLASVPLASAQDAVRYVHLDALGSVRAVSNEANVVIERHDYLPFGEECTTGPCASNPGVGAGQPRKFTGKERDQETGLDYFGARYYGARIGRFTTIDPVYTWRDNLVDPQRWNRYSYVRNSPLRYVDPDGRQTAPPQLGTLDWIIDQFNRIVGLNQVPNYVFMDGQPAVVGVDKDTVGKALIVVGAAAVITDILVGAESGKESKQTIQYRKEGGFEQANRDFDALEPQDVIDRGKGLRTGTLEGGDKVVVRPHSSEGSPTLEIQRQDDKAIKIRYPEAKPAEPQ